MARSSGAVLGLVAPSGTGKTTAAISLGLSGWGYVTDETLGISPELSVVPYPKPLAIVQTGSSRKLSVGPDELGLPEAPGHLVLDRIVLLDRSTVHDTPHLTEVALIDGLLQLIEASSSITALPDPLATLGRVVQRCAGLFRLSYRDIEVAEPLLTNLLSDQCRERYRSAEAWCAVAGSDELSRSSGSPGDVIRTPHRSAIATTDEVLVLVADRPVRLSGIGATAWLAAERWIAPHLMKSVIVDVHGDHPQAAQLTRDAIESLLGVGVLSIAPASACQ
ncbi:MAG: hypothetical protein IPF90_00980 [Actinomycetales bacterium]|nr:hypothetical protein [Candidatus Phosphoribacter baldrii]